MTNKWTVCLECVTGVYGVVRVHEVVGVGDATRVDDALARMDMDSVARERVDHVARVDGVAIEGTM